MNSGKKWCEISRVLPGRNEHSVKNRYFSLLRQEKKRLKKLLQVNNKSKRRKKSHYNSHKPTEIELLRSLFSLKTEEKLLFSEQNPSLMSDTPSFQPKEESHQISPPQQLMNSMAPPMNSMNNALPSLNSMNSLNPQAPPINSYEMGTDNNMFLNNFYNFMPNFLPFSLMNNPFSSGFFPSHNALADTFSNFNQNPFHRLSDSLEKMNLKPKNKEIQIMPEELKIISLSHLDDNNYINCIDKGLESKDQTPIMKASDQNFEENTPNFLQEKKQNILIKTENMEFLNLRVKNFSELTSSEKSASNLKLAVINLEKNEVYFLQQGFNVNNGNNNLTSDSSYRSGSFISMNNSNTSNSLSGKFDNGEDGPGNGPDLLRRSKFVKFMNNE